MSLIVYGTRQNPAGSNEGLMTAPMSLSVGDVVQMRKVHPCGGDTWRIVRVGADIGIRCLRCDRKVMLPRAEFERRVKRVVSTAGEAKV
jgi:hypothetical protein